MCTPEHAGLVGFTGNDALRALTHLAGVTRGGPGISIIVLATAIHTTGTGELTAAFTLPDRVPTGEVTVGAHNGDTAHDGVGAGAVQTGVIAGQERLLVSVNLHIVLTVTRAGGTAFSWAGDGVRTVDRRTGCLTALYITMTTNTPGTRVKVKLHPVSIGLSVVIAGDTGGAALARSGNRIITVGDTTLNRRTLHFTVNTATLLTRSLLPHGGVGIFSTVHTGRTAVPR